ncbi:hypothetical protein FJTKL_01428 [Diaporthe vaccinii]|uniref:DUF7025 domain-containing protein n=1 Tax=Diaporthe vaccinii TaxID=105482 RepID=A0ABR4E0U1_9PEZI
MDGVVDVTLTERVKTLRSTINDVAYVTSALRSDQGNEITTHQPTMPYNETQVHHYPIEGSTITTQSDTGPVKNDEDRTESDTDDEVLEVEEEVKFKQELASRGEKTADPTRTFGIVHKHIVEKERARAHSIEVQHQTLKEILSVIFEGYLYLDPRAPLLEFYPGFEPFVHRWDRLLAAERAEKEGNLKTLLKAFTELLSQELENSFRAFQDFKATGYIEFAHVLLAYKPGDIIMRSKGGILSAGKLRKAIKVKTSSEFLMLKVAVLDWDGESRGYRKKTWRIPNFEGIQRVSDFDFFPLHTHSESDKIKAHLIKRGDIFDSLCGRHMRTFQGHVKDRDGRRSDDTIYVSLFDVSLVEDTRSITLPIQLSERVIVDAKAYHQFYRAKPSLIPLHGHGDTRLSALSTPGYQNPAADDSQDLLILPPLNKTDKMLAVPKVKGFSLESKSWHKFNIDPRPWAHFMGPRNSRQLGA